MKLYSVEVPVWATAYIKAETPEDALRIAQGLKDDVLYLSGDKIEGGAFESLTEDVSLSPVMTVHETPDDTPAEEVHDYAEQEG